MNYRLSRAQVLGFGELTGSHLDLAKKWGRWASRVAQPMADLDGLAPKAARRHITYLGTAL